MADINQIITLGIGTPSDIEHFTLVGLNVNPADPSLADSGSRQSWRHRLRTITKMIAWITFTIGIYYIS